MELGRRIIENHIEAMCKTFNVTEEEVFEAAEIKNADSVLRDIRLPVHRRPMFGKQLRWTGKAHKVILKPRDFEGIEETCAVVVPNDAAVMPIERMEPRCQRGDAVYLESSYCQNRRTCFSCSKKIRPS